MVHVVAQGGDVTSAHSLRGTVKAAATEQSRGDETNEVEPRERGEAVVLMEGGGSASSSSRQLWRREWIEQGGQQEKVPKT